MKLRLLERMVSGDPLHYIQHGGPIVRLDDIPWMDSSTQAIWNEAGDLRVRGGGTFMGLGPMPPPFRTSWWEAKADLDEMGYAVMILSKQNRKRDGWTLHHIAVVEIGGLLILMPWAIREFLDRDGFYLPNDEANIASIDPGGSDYCVRARKLRGDEWVESTVTAQRRLFAAAAAGCAFANCRNVGLDREPERQLTKKQKKRGSIGIEYHHLQIPGMTGISIPRGGTRDLPVHVVRGHFATYTTDAPLFGRHVGTYWHPQHVRGRPEFGEIRHTYEVTA